MGCVMASGAQHSSRTQPGTSHEVFSWTRSCNPAAQKTPKISKLFRFTRGSLVRWLHHIWKNGFHQKSLLFSRRTFLYILGTSPKHLWKRKLKRSRDSLYIVGANKGRKQAKKLWKNCLFASFFWKFEMRILDVNLLLYFKSYVYVAETPTRACLTTFSSVILRSLEDLYQP